MNLEDFRFLRDYVQEGRDKTLQEEFEINKVMYFKVSNISIRRVKNFLKELNNIIDHKEYENYKETVISFFFLKHFMSTAYEKLNIEERLLEIFNFEFDFESYTISELVNLYKIKKIEKKRYNKNF